MTKKTCVFIGGKQIGANCLRQLLKCTVVPQLIIANTDDMGLDTWHESLVKLAKENSLPVIQNKKVKSKEIINEIKKLKPEIIFCIGATQIIPEDILKIPTLGCLNIHPALLPKYRGRYSTALAIFNGEKETGATVHWMDAGIDSGPTIIQKKITIEDTDTAKTLYDKFTKVGEDLFVKFLKKWLSGKKILSRPQNESKATYYPKGLPNQGQINWSWSGKKVFNFIRAMTFEPFPPVSIKIGNKKMVIVDKKYFTGYQKL